MLFIRAGPNTDALPSQASHPNEDYKGNAELVKMHKKKNKKERSDCQYVCVFLLYFMVSWGEKDPFTLM